jgi:disulfide bond formation protein DsbB/mono/diheme cytochrome c family protein
MRSFSYTDIFVQSALYLALTVALVATLGSLYFSEINGFVPCALCWYQRIIMYPLVGILVVGLLRMDGNLPYYILPFTLLGQGIATYHYLLQKTMLFGAPTVCRAGVSCAVQYINWYGFITIPFLAMTAFFIITILALVALTSGEPNEDGRNAPPWIPVLGVLIVIGGIFYYLFQTNAPQTSSLTLSELPAGDFTPAATAIPDEEATDTQVEGDFAHGAALYQEACATCHGLEGQGAPGLGNDLTDSTLVRESPPGETLQVVREGIDANDPANETGVAMPPSGGRPDLADDEILEIIAYLRSLNHQD